LRHHLPYRLESESAAFSEHFGISRQPAPKLNRKTVILHCLIYELYDLEKDPGEMENVAGNPEYAKVDRELKAALQDKMILDYDYLPLPVADKGMRKGATEEGE